MKTLNLFCAFSLLGLAFAGCSNDKSAAPAAAPVTATAPAAAAPTPAPSGSEVAVITTSEGVMVLEFYPDLAPKHVENFKTLAKKGFYDGTAFHRVIPGFMIQGGDPNTKDESAKGSWGMGGPGYTINAEFNAKPHTRGILSMARTPDPNSAGSQFFICLSESGTNPGQYDYASSLDGKYTVFGNLIKGFDVLDKIATTPTEGPDRPVKRMAIESIKIVPADSVK